MGLERHLGDRARKMVKELDRIPSADICEKYIEKQQKRAEKYMFSGQFIATSAEVTPNGGLVRESHQNFLESG